MSAITHESVEQMGHTATLLKMPLVTIVIPMKNAEPYVREAVESVLSQEGIDLEVIVVNDGSTDRSADVVRSIDDPRIRMVPGPCKGIAAAFNAGLDVARGSFVARCDADDVFPVGRLAWQVGFLSKHAHFGAVCGSFTLMNQHGRVLAERKSYGGGMDVTPELRRGSGRSHMAAYLFRTDLVQRLGGCRTYFVMAEDVDFQFRLSEITEIWYEPRSAYFYRLHDQSITHVQRASERSWFEGCAMQFQRQRLTRADRRDDLSLGRPPAMPNMGKSAPLTVKQQIQKLLLGQAWAAHSAGLKGEGLSLALRAYMADPLQLGALRSVVAMAFKPARPFI
jgi:glycosyltransferase involved in cell wall biosynthesis